MVRIPPIDPKRPNLAHLFDRYKVSADPDKEPTIARFKRFHLENKHIFWDLFVPRTLKAMETHKKYGARKIFEEIRWDVKKGIIRGYEVFEVNDDYVPVYARLFVYYWPQFMGFFELRSPANKGIMSEEERRRRGEEPWSPDDHPDGWVH